MGSAPEKQGTPLDILAIVVYNDGMKQSHYSEGIYI